MPTDHFENAIVGGGKGGKTLAMHLAAGGEPTVMIERGMIGGSCINVACIPTKTMVKSAKAAHLARHAAPFGLQAEFRGVDPLAVRSRKRAVVADMVTANQANFARSGMTLIIGDARFSGPRQLEVDLAQGGRRTVTAERVFINTGTRPFLPDLPGIKGVRPLTSESIQELDRLPEHLVVLGGGYIGLEFAQMFRRFGSRVTVLERGPRFLPREDPDIADAIGAIFAEEGIEVIHSATVQALEGESGKSVRVRIGTPTGDRMVEGSDLLVAIGRVPNTQVLNLAAAAVETDARGFIKVNERLETSAPGIWALGDVNGGPQFTHVSLDDCRVVAASLAGGDRTTRDRLVPYTLFIDPELGRVGLTEERARQLGHSIRVARLPVAAIPRARTLGETRGLLKAVVDATTDQILGAAILAPEGGEIMAVVQVAMQARLPYTFLRDNIFAHPTLAEGLNDLFARVQ